jgi:hypothetical protein
MPKVKEVLVGVIATDDGKGKVAKRQIMFAGPNPFIAPGIYNEDNPPVGWTWMPFLEKAKKHDGCGVAVIYEGDEKPAMRAVVEKYMQEAEEQRKKQAAVIAAMKNGEHATETKVEPKPDAKSGAGDK